MSPRQRRPGTGGITPVTDPAHAHAAALQVIGHGLAAGLAGEALREHCRLLLDALGLLGDDTPPAPKAPPPTRPRDADVPLPDVLDPAEAAALQRRLYRQGLPIPARVARLAAQHRAARRTA